MVRKGEERREREMIVMRRREIVSMKVSIVEGPIPNAGAEMCGLV
jgi:hypothetical protein